MTDPGGPIYGVGFQHVLNGEYTIAYMPDAHNDELQREGKAPVYYWLPNDVRLAQKGNGDYKFHLTHFAGIRSADTHVGAEAEEEISGGLIGFSTTAKPPNEVLKQSEDELGNRFRGSDDHWWGWRTPVTPMFMPAPIVSNVVAVTNLSPAADGSLPAVEPAPGGGGAPAPGGGGAPAPGGGAPPNRAVSNRSLPPVITRAWSVPVKAQPRLVRSGAGFRASNLDRWYANLQGQGAGSVSPLAENAFSGLLGTIPTAIVWDAFHGGTSQVTVWQNLNLKVRAPMMRLKIEGDWQRIQSHYSGHAHAGGWFWSADIKAEFNNLRMSGDIIVTMEVDSTVPGADKLQEEMNKRSDLIVQKFLDQAQKTIFEPAPFTEEAAKAGGGFLGWGGGAAFKLRRDTVTLRLNYEENRQLTYLQSYPISGALEGLHDAIRDDPEAERKYFTTLDLGDWDREVSRTFKPVVNWPDPAQQWVGEPVAFLSVQVGYPNSEGVLQWDGSMFQATDGPEAIWSSRTRMKAKNEVTNPPAGWEPDRMFVKRQIHFTEPPSEAENPYARVQVEKNVVDLDPGDIGTVTTELNDEVRVDNVGTLSVGPIALDTILQDASQVVEVTFKAAGKTHDGHDRAPARFSWQFADQDKPRYWMIFTGQPEYVPQYQYQVRVIVRGSIFSEGMEWTGPWEEGSGNGQIMVRVPRSTERGVSTRELPFVPATKATGNGARPPAPSRPPAQPVASTRPGGPPPTRTRTYRGGNGAQGTDVRDNEGDVVFQGPIVAPAGRGA
jgi:hypothetical protein